MLNPLRAPPVVLRVALAIDDHLVAKHHANHQNSDTNTENEEPKPTSETRPLTGHGHNDCTTTAKLRQTTHNRTKHER